jgi:hypothetical protein
LYYLKTYPLQEVIAFHFEMSQAQANDWIHRLSRILKAALDQQGSLPERNPEKVKETAADTPAREFVIDGTERQRPQDPEAQSDYYSGTKKKHTVKNNLIVRVKDRLIKYRLVSVRSEMITFTHISHFLRPHSLPGQFAFRQCNACLTNSLPHG